MKAKCSLYWLIFNVPNTRHFLCFLCKCKSDFLAFYEPFLFAGKTTKKAFLFFCFFLFSGFSILSIACLQFRSAKPCIKCFRSVGITDEFLSRFFGFSDQSFTLRSYCVCKACLIYTLNSSEVIFFWMPADHWSVYTLKPISGLSGAFFLSLFVFNLPHIKCHNVVSFSYWSLWTFFLFLWRSMLLFSCKALHFWRN